MPNNILIYVIVLLNALCQIMLIWRFKSLGERRWLFVAGAVGLPAILAAAMRLLIVGGVIHGRLADQSRPEQLLTQFMSILLLAGPWLVTAAAVFYNSRHKSGRATV